MPKVTVNGTEYAYIDEGSGPLLFFGHGLLASKEMFRAQIDALSDRFRCVSVDWPGHADSGPPPEGWDFWRMAEDMATMTREVLGEQEAVFAGLSQGGFGALRLALRHPEMVRALILMDTSAGPEPAENQEPYHQLSEAMLHGDEPTRRGTAEAAAAILYGQSWRDANPETLEHEIQLMLGHDREGQYAAEHAVFDRDDIRDQISAITAPTLVICGEEDIATVPEKSHELVARIEGSTLVMIPSAGHHSALENPAAVTAAIEEFLESLDRGGSRFARDRKAQHRSV
jgi:pimeloyl-ACP methyl ester carboxylesterase